VGCKGNDCKRRAIVREWTSRIDDQVTGRRFDHGTGFVRWRSDKDPKKCTFDQLAPELKPSELKSFLGLAHLVAGEALGDPAASGQSAEIGRVEGGIPLGKVD
jgi:hypothetical protein